jgi:hypothetical protein
LKVLKSSQDFSFNARRRLNLKAKSTPHNVAVVDIDSQVIQKNRFNAPKSEDNERSKLKQSEARSAPPPYEGDVYHEERDKVTVDEDEEADNPSHSDANIVEENTESIAQVELDDMLNFDGMEDSFPSVRTAFSSSNAGDMNDIDGGSGAKGSSKLSRDELIANREKDTDNKVKEALNFTRMVRLIGFTVTICVM